MLMKVKGILALSYVLSTFIFECAWDWVGNYFLTEDEEDEDVHLVPNSSDDAPRNASVQGPIEAAPLIPTRPFGRVVGIIKRNWHS